MTLPDYSLTIDGRELSFPNGEAYRLALQTYMEALATGAPAQNVALSAPRTAAERPPARALPGPQVLPPARPGVGHQRLPDPLYVSGSITDVVDVKEPNLLLQLIDQPLRWSNNFGRPPRSYRVSLETLTRILRMAQLLQAAAASHGVDLGLDRIEEPEPWWAGASARKKEKQKEELAPSS